MPPPPRAPGTRRCAARRALEAALAFALPQCCALCGAPCHRAALCAPCTAALPRPGRGLCPRCGLPGAIASGAHCPHCARSAPSWDAARAAWVYAFPVDRLVQRLKYGGQMWLAGWLGASLAPLVPASTDAIVPMPLAASRLRTRGFNQALELARALARETGLPLRTAASRVRSGAPQAGLAFAARHANVLGAFACEARLDGLELAVVDDVMTTGATVDALARVLKAAGAKRVVAVVVARALPPAP